MRNPFYVLPFLAFLTLVSCKPPLEAVAVQPRLYEIDEQVARPQVPATDQAAAEATALIAPYKAQLDAKMQRELATIVTPLRKSAPESNLGNWMADLLQAAAEDIYPDKKIAFTTANQGGVRVNEIGAGPLIVSEIYELMPFDNELVLLELTGKEVTEFVSHIANSGGWPVSAELSVRQEESGKLVIRISGQPVSPTATYFVALPDYVANGGSNSSMLRAKEQITVHQLMRDLL
ncbi:MAG: 5'-nucleotidase, partial [Bacteroidota bacterium]